MTITQLSNTPLRGDPEFNDKAADWNGRQLPRLVTEMNEAIVEVNDNTVSAALSAAQAAAQADLAGAAVEGLGNYRGPWATLSGALTPPASVFHAGRFWLLTEAVTNIALSEPGVDVSKWVPVRRGAIVTAANTQALAGDDIVFNGSAAVTATLPAGPSSGDTVIITRTGTGLVTVARNGSTIYGLAENLLIDQRDWRIRLIFIGGTWRTSLEGLVA